MVSSDQPLTPADTTSTQHDSGEHCLFCQVVSTACARTCVCVRAEIHVCVFYIVVCTFYCDIYCTLIDTDQIHYFAPYYKKRFVNLFVCLCVFVLCLEAVDGKLEEVASDLVERVLAKVARETRERGEGEEGSRGGHEDKVKERRRGGGKK